MFKIQDGREYFYQWDINRYIVVEDSSIKQVHYCNRTGDCSLVCPVIEKDGELVASVPNILLQTSWPINIYGYDEGYTKHSEAFRVIPRSRPEDYVYTEEDIKLWSELEQRVINLEENGIPEETISQKIADYFVDHPIPTPDLTGYATTEYVDNAVDSVEVDLTGYATELYVEQQIEAIEIPDVSGFAKTEDIPDVSGYQTEEQVIALIKEHGGGGSLPASEEGEF